MELEKICKNCWMAEEMVDESKVKCSIAYRDKIKNADNNACERYIPVNIPGICGECDYYVEAKYYTDRGKCTKDNYREVKALSAPCRLFYKSY